MINRNCVNALLSFFIVFWYDIVFAHMQYGEASIMRASRYSHATAVQLLLEAGADKDTKDNVRERVNDYIACVYLKPPEQTLVNQCKHGVFGNN